MHLRLDSAKCEGFGPCSDAAPDLFELDEWGYAKLQQPGPLTADKADNARRAVKACPVSAITIVED